VRAKQAGNFSLLTAPHSSDHKDSQMLLCNIRESKMQSEQHFHKGKGHFATGKKGTFCVFWKLGCLAPPGPPGSYSPVPHCKAELRKLREELYIYTRNNISYLFIVRVQQYLNSYKYKTALELTMWTN
jgi:hypothetical protein